MDESLITELLTNPESRIELQAYDDYAVQNAANFGLEL